MTMQLVPKGTSTTVSTSFVMTISDYGPQATPTPPPADQTTDLIALLEVRGQAFRPRRLKLPSLLDLATVTTPSQGD